MTNAFKLLLLAVGILGFSAPMQASAQSLSTCSGSCVCTGTEIDDYGNCTIINESGMIDIMDPADVASKTGLTASYTGGEVQVSVDIDEPAGVIIPVNDYNGDWPDVATLHGYLDGLYDGNVPEAYFPDFCTKFLGYDLYEQDGAIARWNPSTGDWASFQIQDVVMAAIVSDNGRLFIGGKKVFDTPVLVEGCLTDTDNALSGETCSRILTASVEQEENVCEEDNGEGGSLAKTITVAVAEERDIKWFGKGTEVQYSGSLAGGDLKFEIKRVVAETVEATGLWYDSGTYAGQKHNISFGDDHSVVRRTGSDGVCTSPGEAQRDENVLGVDQPRIVSGETREGSAPTTCPTE